MRVWALATALVLVSGAARAATCDRPTPVVFEPGSASVTIASPGGNSSDCYQVTARGNQVLTITVDNAEDDVSFALYAPGWATKCNSAEECDLQGDLLTDDETKTWSDTTETPGVYLIVVDNSKSGEDYELTVEMK
jgi:hypothetical protein